MIAAVEDLFAGAAQAQSAADFCLFDPEVGGVNRNVQARTEMTLRKVAVMSDQEAWDYFAALRWKATGGEVYCPQCGTEEPYWLKARRRWKCKTCAHQFSVTSGTIFASRKLPLRVILMALVLFVNARKGISSCQLSRDLGIQQKTAFVLAHKIREAISAEAAEIKLFGEVEIDGSTFGGHRRNEPTVRTAIGMKQRYVTRKHENRRVLVVAKERDGRTIVSVGKREMDARPFLEDRIADGAVIHADQAHAWDGLSNLYEMMRVNHKRTFKENGACTNNAESFWALFKRMHLGTHHKMSGGLMGRYADEMAWRCDFEKMRPGQRVELVLSMCLAAPVSRRWARYWQEDGARGGVEPAKTYEKPAYKQERYRRRMLHAQNKRENEEGIAVLAQSERKSA